MSSAARRAAGLLVLMALVAGCSAPDPGSQADGARGEAADVTDRTTGTAEPLPTESSDVSRIFGPQFTARQDGSFGLDRWSTIDDGPSGMPGQAFRVSYPAGSVSPSASREYGVPEGGMQVFLSLASGPLESAHLRYWVRFPEDFEFVRGGKLPGLYGGTEVSGGEEPDGTDGFSTRLMWRADGEGEVYLYAPGKSGTSLGRGEWTWRRGAWLCVEQHVQLDQPGRDDGSVIVRIDGMQTFAEKDMTFRTVDELRIEGVFFSTFYGGADPSWSPEAHQHADFAGFTVSDRPIGCG